MTTRSRTAYCPMVGPSDQVCFLTALLWSLSIREIGVAARGKDCLQCVVTRYRPDARHSST
eukprot:13642-Eustigmatos_ZCMA.PRE.1